MIHSYDQGVMAGESKFFGCEGGQSPRKLTSYDSSNRSHYWTRIHSNFPCCTSISLSSRFGTVQLIVFSFLTTHSAMPLFKERTRLLSFKLPTLLSTKSDVSLELSTPSSTVTVSLGNFIILVSNCNSLLISLS